jgi:hypothetical protein
MTERKAKATAEAGSSLRSEGQSCGGTLDRKQQIPCGNDRKKSKGKGKGKGKSRSGFFPSLDSGSE